MNWPPDDKAKGRHGNQPAAPEITPRERSDNSKSFRVVARKVSTGALITFSRYATRHEADDVVAALARMRCPAFVELDDRELPT